jgi:phospholipid-binding lipoprotein MlaA
MLTALLGFFLSGSPSAHADEDPWIGLNRKVHQVNNFADRFVLKPLAKGYQKLLPGFAERSVSNFFNNVDDLDNLVNNFAQGKPAAGISDAARLLINSSIGIGGLLDPASRMGLVRHEEDWGQTLSVWGLGRGPYVEIPLMGPGTVTDLLARPLDTFFNPLRYLYPVDHRNSLLGLGLVEDRASVLAAEGAIFGDRYIFIRDAYMQRRDYLIKDGEVSDPFDDEFF